MYKSRKKIIATNAAGITFFRAPALTNCLLECIILSIRQHRTKTIYWILHVSCLHLFRHIAQFVLARRQPCFVLIVLSDEKSDGAIHAQSLCGIAIEKIFNTPLKTY